MIPTSVYKWLAGLAIVLALVLGAGYKGYQMGVEHQEGVYAAAQAKANAVVVKKNEEVQEIADKQAEAQVIYKDRIKTEYLTITKEVITYVQTPAANVGLDSEFVRLHNNAARSNNAIQITEATSGVDGEAAPVGVTTGEAIGIITRNYEAYYQCVGQVEGWQQFYINLQKEVNK